MSWPPRASRFFEHVVSYSNFYTIIINSNVLPGFQNRICDLLKELTKRDLVAVNNTNTNVNIELFSSYTAYALFGLIIEWVKGGFKYTANHMAEQLIEILSFNSHNVIINTSNQPIKQNSILLTATDLPQTIKSHSKIMLEWLLICNL